MICQYRHCNVEFVPEVPNRKYCCKQHKRKEMLLRKKGNSEIDLSDYKICANELCKMKFLRPKNLSNYHWKIKKYCSSHCRRVVTGYKQFAT